MNKDKKKKIVMLDEFQKRCCATAVYPKECKVLYPALGLAGEMGEFLEVLLKMIWPTEKDCKGILECNIYAALTNLAAAAKNCETLKKMIRDSSKFDKDLQKQLAKKVEAGVLGASIKDREALMAEMGDFASWYSNVLASDLGFAFQAVLKNNLKKVERRKKEGKLHGSGSNR